MRKLILLIALIFLLVLSLYAGTVFMAYRAEPGTNSVSITWTTSTEDNISKFAILRSISYDANYSEISTVPASGPGSTYTYVDENVIFKTSQTFYYKIEARGSSDNSVDITEVLIVNPNISGIYRTWGAIKAMFR